MTGPTALLGIAYEDLSSLLSALTEDEGWQPTGCAGWTPVDLGFHLLGDARRALVALATPATAPADTDAVSYWTAWRPPSPGDDDELWSTRIAASTQGGLAAIAERYAETAAAVVVAAGRVGATDRVRTQGRVLTVADLLSTLVVEAAVHHLDLVAHLDRPGPADEPLAEVRRVLEGLAPGPLPPRWDDVTAARRGTGRERLSAADRLELGPGAARFPLFG
ncbi:maleylpyruvate isomerase N-terminal domain-containing protein [Modestobacter marinus]|uniref:maleylpyruvate isomerase N-terminal domain-containing protein n=1 Tax=Modestobacter marinus TaxID=477641 RepID=UPI001C97CFF1|nr:maleylpyruvate isomerase N-terminal domain-containing protein [Modestobacter marinus]